ncbi:MAG: hypothetical protein KF819_06565 [Labilithrix sp.]|nr:hypothetical protein [Labilithrix sp.]
MRLHHACRLDSLTLFPLVTKRSDARGRTPLVTFDEGLRICLVQVQRDTTRVLYREDLEDMEIDPDVAYFAARQRLARLVAARLISVRALRAPQGPRCLVFQHSYLAASCLVLPNLFELAYAALEVDRMCAVVARRDLLTVLPDPGPGRHGLYPVVTLTGPMRRPSGEHTISIDVSIDDEETKQLPTATVSP